MMAASAASPAFQLNHSPAGAASFADQVSGSAIDLDSVAKPLFCGESGYGNISSNSARATRRRETDAGGRSFSRRHQSFSEEIGHAAAKTYLITRLTFKLLSYLGVGYRWITRLLALACYAMLLLPGFLQGRTNVDGVHLPSANRLSRGHFQNVCSRESGCYMLHCCRSEMDESEHISGTLKRLLSETASQANYCARKHKVPLLLVEALHHLHIFIFVLAIVHVTFCALTVLFGGARIQQWKHWEDSISKDNYDT